MFANFAEVVKGEPTSGEKETTIVCRASAAMFKRMSVAKPTPPTMSEWWRHTLAANFAPDSPMSFAVADQPAKPGDDKATSQVSPGSTRSLHN